MNFWSRNPDNLYMMLWDIKYSEKLSLSLFHPPKVNISNFHNLFGGLLFSHGLEKTLTVFCYNRKDPCT